MDMAGWTWSGFITFLMVWAVMMAAMMFPAVAPLLLMHRSMAGDGRGTGLRATWAFAAGYLLVWTLVGAATWALVQVGVELGSRLGSASGEQWRRSRSVRPWSSPGLPVHATQADVPAPVPVAGWVPDDPMAAGIPRRGADGADARALLPGLLLGALRGAGCGRRDERRVDALVDGRSCSRKRCSARGAGANA